MSLGPTTKCLDPNSDDSHSYLGPTLLTVNQLGLGFSPWALRHQKPILTLCPNFNQSRNNGHFDAGPITLREPISILDTQGPIRMWKFWNWSDFTIKYTCWSDFVNCPFPICSFLWSSCPATQHLLYFQNHNLVFSTKICSLIYFIIRNS